MSKTHRVVRSWCGVHAGETGVTESGVLAGRVQHPVEREIAQAVDAEKLARARSMVAKGLTVREAAIRLKVGKTALYEALRLAAGENMPSVVSNG